MLILWAIELRVAASTASLCFRTFSVKETTKLKFISKRDTKYELGRKS